MRDNLADTTPRSCGPPFPGGWGGLHYNPLKAPWEITMPQFRKRPVEVEAVQRIAEDRRPHRALSEPGDEWVVTHAVPSGRKTRYTLRQVGWHGQTGAFYSLDEDPKPYEPGSWSPLWIVAHTDRLDEAGNPL